ncbi:MAG: hypothetical protein JWP13_636 [Candidatus Saccharibacteria bacterium]|nr:hypothetical protein [Candidatus Saccharibacteria bacterium]
MLSPDKVQNLSIDLPSQVEKRWDSKRIKELTLVLGATGVAALGTIDGFLPRDPEFVPTTVVSGPAFPVEADSDMYPGQGLRDPIRDPHHEESSLQSSYDPTKTPAPSVTEEFTRDAADISTPNGSHEFIIVPEGTKQLPIVSAETPQPSEQYNIAQPTNEQQTKAGLRADDFRLAA